ncbi:H(+)/Cl(-) exchange transporter 7-like [Antedon mediterranea]|uniref:H(+)/Cl(-) exchange transporter 7-like n=1 Tax=Antedon mediterranea TaxID=105859 RepID=UPI003AF6483F
MALNEKTHLLESGRTTYNGSLSQSDVGYGNSLQVEHDEDVAANDVRMRRTTWDRSPKSPEEVQQMGTMKLLSSKFESLDYDIVENSLYFKEQKQVGSKTSMIRRIQTARWFVMLLIGVITACIAAFIDVMIDKLAGAKYALVSKYIDHDLESTSILIPFLLWLAVDVGFVSIAAILVTFVEPVAAGSGIPQIKCYLNGVKIPHVVRIKTLFTKVIGVIFGMSGGLAIGKEGPMIHSGAVVAAGISQGRSTSFKFDCKLFQYFRSDHEKRDFVSGGAAAGVSAAFGAPVGGVLFSLEEGASFWNQSLTWRIFFASMVSTFTLNVLLSYYHNDPWSLSSPGLVNFGQFEGKDYYGYEIPIFIAMAVIGGLLGALFNTVNYRLSVFRIKYLYKRWMHLVEAMLVASVTATLAFLAIYNIQDCRSLPQEEVKYPLQMFCADGEYSATASLFFSTPEASIKNLFHDPPDAYSVKTLLVFFIVYFLLSCWTYGLNIPSGLFIPCILTGAAWGRLCGILINTVLPDAQLSDPGKYALIGAAAHLGGVLRMTISLTVILIEATGNITYGLPLMLVLVFAKWIGDIFNEGLYDIHIQLQSVPILPWEPPQLTANIHAREVMNQPVVTLNTIENVGRIIDVLSCKDSKHNGFPVVDPHDQNGSTFGTFRGLILRDQLLIILKHKAYSTFPLSDASDHKLRTKDFQNSYPRFPDISTLNITHLERQASVDLRPFMNQAPYSVSEDASLPRIFRLFRAIGLRHLVVVNDCNEVVGIVTRKDLARFRVSGHGVGLEQLFIST